MTPSKYSLRHPAILSLWKQPTATIALTVVVRPQSKDFQLTDPNTDCVTSMMEGSLNKELEARLRTQHNEVPPDIYLSAWEESPSPQWWATEQHQHRPSLVLVLHSHRTAETQTTAYIQSHSILPKTY